MPPIAESDCPVNNSLAQGASGRLEFPERLPETRTAMASARKRTPPSMSSLIEAFAPSREIPTAPAVLQARRNALARTRFLETFGALEAKDAVALAGYRSKNPHEQVGRWLASGKAFAVEWGGRRLLPAFQFDESSGQPRPEVAALLTAFEGRRKGWEIALWMTSPNGWLGGKRPIDFWPAKIEKVLEAARLEVAPVGT